MISKIFLLTSLILAFQVGETTAADQFPNKTQKNVDLSKSVWFILIYFYFFSWTCILLPILNISSWIWLWITGTQIIGVFKRRCRFTHVKSLWRSNQICRYFTLYYLLN